MKVKRNGFTSMEMVVTVAVMLILVSILLPILTGIRETGRRAHCINNLKQLGIAFHMYAAENGGSLPASAWWDSTSPIDPVTGGYTIGGTWAYDLGPYVLDGAAGNAATPYLCKTYVALNPEYETAPNPIETTYGMPEGWAPAGDLPLNNASSTLDWVHMDAIVRPHDTILLAPCMRIAATTWNGSPIESGVILNSLANADRTRHNGGANYLYVDSHVSWKRNGEDGQWWN